MWSVITLVQYAIHNHRHKYFLMSRLIKQIELLMLSLLYRRGITKQLTVMLDIIAQSDNYRISTVILQSHFDKNNVI